jgi:hypothetical protein
MTSEVVFEVEKVLLVRRRVRTQERFCVACRRETDFISLTQAAALFMMETELLSKLVYENSCHLQTDADGDVCICLVAFSEVLGPTKASPTIRAMGNTYS